MDGSAFFDGSTFVDGEVRTDDLAEGLGKDVLSVDVRFDGGVRTDLVKDARDEAAVLFDLAEGLGK